MPDLPFLVSGVFCVMLRLTPAIMMSGVGPYRLVPLRVRFLMLLLMSAMVFGTVSNVIVVPEQFGLALISYEFIIGLLLFFPIQLIFVSLEFWGKVVDMQMGLGAAAVMNPASQSHGALVGAFLNIAGVTLFFSLGLHRELLTLFGYSYQVLDLGTPSYQLDLPRVLAYTTTVLLYGLSVVFPVILMLWLLDVFIGLLSKSMPQMNIYFVSLPLKMVMGFLLLSVTLRSGANSFILLFEETLAILI